MSEELKPCGECGMPCTPGEYHPFGACLMFKGCHNSATVRANLEAIRRPAPDAGVLTALRFSVVALAHATKDNPGNHVYEEAYQKVDAALSQSNQQEQRA